MKKAIYFIAMLLFGFSSYAQEPELIVRTNKTTVRHNDQILVKYFFTAMGGEFTPPANITDDFYVLSQGGPMTMHQNINGRVTEYVEYQFQLRARNLGGVTLQPATMEYKGKTYTSDAIGYTIVQGSQDEDSPEAIAARLTYMRIIPTKLKVYEGEPFGITYKLYGYVNDLSGQLSFLETPSYDGFIKENIDASAQRRREKDNEGKPVNTWNVTSFSLIPQRPGTFEFDPLVTQIPTPVATNQRNFFGQRITTSVNNVDKAYHPDITVLPLPREGRPANYSGAVGEMKFTAELSRSDVEVNESVTLTLQLSGKGNLNIVDLPAIDLPDQLEVYEPKDDRSIHASASGISGTIKREYIIVPRYRGTYKIPAISFSYFDPNSEKYVVVEAEERTIEVTGDGPVHVASENPTTPSSAPDPRENPQQDVDILSDDIRWIHSVDQTSQKSLPFYTRWWFVGGAGGSVVLTAWLMAVGSIRKWRTARGTRVAAYAKRTLSVVENANTWKGLQSSFEQYLFTAFGIPIAHQVGSILMSELQKHHFTEAEAKGALQLLHDCQAGEYGTSAASMERTKQDIKVWIQNSAK